MDENNFCSNNKQELLKFVHTSDLHLDSTFHGISEINSELGQKLFNATFQAYDYIINFCIQKKVDFLLIAGDVYESADKSLYAQLRFLDGLRKLEAEDISVYIAHGNHDPLGGWSASLDWPKNVNILSGDIIDTLNYEKDGEIATRIRGISYSSNYIRKNLAKEFPKKEANDNIFTIGLLHCTIGTGNGHEPYAPCSIQDLKELNYNYWALGHIHTPWVVKNNDPVIIYPGNPQGRHPGEQGPRGCYYVTVDMDREISIDFIETDSIRWHIEEISIDELETEGDLIEKIGEHIDAINDMVDGKSIICRFILTGRGLLHSIISKEGVLDDILQRFRDEEISESDFVWVERLVNNTSFPIDRDMLLNRKDFIGDIVNIADSLQQNKIPLRSLKKSVEPLFSSAQGRKYLESIDEEELIDLLHKAENMLLDYVFMEEHENRIDSD